MLLTVREKSFLSMASNPSRASYFIDCRKLLIQTAKSIGGR